MRWLAKLNPFHAASAPGLALTAGQQTMLAQAVWQSPLTSRQSGQQAYDEARFVVLDVEASGLNMAKDRLLAIGAVGVCRGVIHPEDSFEVVLQQRAVSAADNILIHGISGQQQREGENPAAALLAFLEYVGASPLVAYHAEFDQAMLRRALREVLGINFEPPWLDLAWLMPELFAEIKDGETPLDTWLTAFDIPVILRHNALADAVATAQLLQMLLPRAAQRGVLTPAALAGLEKNRRWRRQMG